jgi:glutamyl-Q tRNA(Asp) synthetase
LRVPVTITSRFAPSPTGPLHLGHAWSAVQAHDFARAAGGRFLLRIEDIDGTRSRPEHVRGILDDLAWLGIDFDGPVTFQSERVPLYAEALEKLRATGHVYRCFCTRSEIEAYIAAAGLAPHDGDIAPPHPESCRHRSSTEIDERLARNEPFAWRLDMAAAFAPYAGIGWEDDIAGRQVADPLPAGDIVLWRKDAPASYHLAVTVDDAAQGVTHVVRGRDLFDATHVHRLLQAMLGLPTPTYRHHALLTDTNGQRLAKRHGAPTLADLRADYPDGRVLADALRAGDLPIGFAVTQD